MIVLLDIEKQIIECYSDEGKISIPFVDASKLFSYAGEEKIYYVTNATETTAEEIIKLLLSIGVKIHQNSKTPMSNKKYIHAVDDGTVLINEKLRFEGKFDIRPYDKAMEEIVKKSGVLQNLIKNKKVEIVGEIRKEALLKELKVIMDKKDALRKKADAQLDKILLDKKVDEFDGTISEDSEAIVIEMSEEASGRRRIGNKEDASSVSGMRLPSQPTSMEALMSEIDLLEQGKR